MPTISREMCHVFSEKTSIKNSTYLLNAMCLSATGFQCSLLDLVLRTHPPHLRWLDAFHGAMILGGGCSHLEMS